MSQSEYLSEQPEQSDQSEQLKHLLETHIVGLESPKPRTLKHRRTFCFEVYEREDGLWDIDAQMQDHKSYELVLGTELRPVGKALHDMVVRVTIDNEMTIVDVSVRTVAAPYMLQCTTITPDYHKLVGLNVLKGFRYKVKERFGDTLGCTHLTELVNKLPTVAVQGISTELIARQLARERASGELSLSNKKPFQLDKCHALSTDGEIARLYYPKWYKDKVDNDKLDNDKVDQGKVEQDKGLSAE